MRKIHILYVSVILISAIIISTSVLVGTGTVDTSRFFEEHYHMKKAVSENLINPESAKFRNIENMDPLEDDRFCGEVNGKNKFGSYAGWKKFRAEKDSEEWSAMIGDIARTLCE